MTGIRENTPFCTLVTRITSTFIHVVIFRWVDDALPMRRIAHVIS